MKRIIIPLFALATLVAGCVVSAIHPFYSAKDVTFDPALLGVWADATNADKESWTFEKVGDQTYKLVIAETDKKTEFDAHLFKLGGQLFLDCLSRERPDYNAPTHLLLRVDTIQPQLELRPMDYAWLAKLIEQNPKLIRHVIVPKPADGSKDDGLLVLTATTEELQKFIRNHLKTKEAWSDALVLVRK